MPRVGVLVTITLVVACGSITPPSTGPARPTPAQPPATQTTVDTPTEPRATDLDVTAPPTTTPPDPATTPAFTPWPSPFAPPEQLSVVWREDDCFMYDVTETLEARLIAVGGCLGPDGDYGVAWESRNGFEWKRVLETGPGMNLSGVSTDGTPAGAAIVGNAFDGQAGNSPRVWSGDLSNGFELAELPTDIDGASVERIAWDGSRLMSVGWSQGELSPNMFNGVAWMDSGDGSGWRQIAVPEESLSFTDVLGTGEPDEASFLICGEVQLAEYYLTADRVWQLDDDAAWTPALVPARAGAPDGGVRRLIDPHTAFSHFDFWTELDGQWQRRGFGLDFQAFAGVRLQDGLLVSGFPEPTLDGNPLGLRVAKFADDWSRVRQVPSHANALIEDFEVFGDVVIGVGDAVYMGPGRVDDYLLF